MFRGGIGVKADLGNQGASVHVGANGNIPSPVAQVAVEPATKPKMRINVPEDLIDANIRTNHIEDAPRAPGINSALSDSLLNKADLIRNELNEFGVRCDQQDLVRAGAQLQMYFERINALQLEVNNARLSQKLTATEVTKLDESLALLQHSYKEVRNLLSLYGNTSDMQQLLTNIDIEAVNRAMSFADQFRMKTTDDGFVSALQKCSAREVANTHEHLLNRDICAVTDMWRNLQKLARCITHQIDNAALHAQFYATAFDYERLMPSAICSTRRSLWLADVNKSTEDSNGELNSNELFVAFDEVLYTLTCWWQRVQQLAVRSRKIQAVTVRSQNGTPAIRLPAKILSDYESDDACLKKEETVFVVEQIDRAHWIVETTRHQSVTIPALICAIISPDVQAIEQTLKVKRALLLEWTLAVRDSAAHAMLVLLSSFQRARKIASERNVQFAAFAETTEEFQLREVVRSVLTEAENSLARGEAVNQPLFDVSSNRLFIETDFVDSKTGNLYNPAQLRNALPTKKLAGFQRLLSRRLFEWRSVADCLHFERDSTLLDEHCSLNARQARDSTILYNDLVTEIDALTTLFDHAAIVFQIEATTTIDDATLSEILAAHTLSDDTIKRFQQIYRVWQLVRRELETSDSAADELTGELLTVHERAGTSDEDAIEQLETNLEELINTLLSDEADEQEVAQSLDAKLRLLLRYYTDRKKMEKRRSFLFDDSAQRYVLEASRPDLEEFRDVVTEKQQLYIDVSTGTIFAEADYCTQPVRRAKKDAQLDAYFVAAHALDDTRPVNEVDIEEVNDEPLVTNEYKLVVNAGDNCDCDLHRYRPRMVRTWNGAYSNSAPIKQDEYDSVPPEFVNTGETVPSRPVSRPESRASQTDPQDELVKTPCIATQTTDTVPFAARPKKGNLKIIAVYDTQQKTYVSKKEAYKLGILNKETKQFWNRRKNQYIWVGDAIVKGFIRLGVKTATGAPYSDLTVQPVKREKRMGSIGDEAETASLDSSVDGQNSIRLRVRPRI